MRVLCIDNKPRRGGKTTWGSSTACYLLAEGMTYTVEEDIGEGYKLMEVIHPYPEVYWAADRFIPLSDKDETEYSEEILEKLFVPKTL